MKLAPSEPAARSARPPERFVEDHAGCIRLYLREVGRIEALSPQEEARLVLRARQGNRKAREQLIKACLRRVVEISRDFENMGLPLLDLISEGNVGFLKAIERFEPNSGVPFSSVSTWWIRQSIKRALTAGPKLFPRNPAVAAGEPPINV